MSVTIGVLALQGAFAKHADMLRSLGAKVIEVRKPADLADCDALVIPGGESTTIMKQMVFIDFVDPFLKFSSQKPVFGTCAGLILMSRKIAGDKMQPLDLFDVEVERNAYGRQVESFHSTVDIELKPGHEKQVPAVFIRAPRILKSGNQVQILAHLNKEPVLIRQGNHLGSTFHPELTSDTTIHSYFLGIVAATKKALKAE